MAAPPLPRAVPGKPEHPGAWLWKVVLMVRLKSLAVRQGSLCRVQGTAARGVQWGSGTQLWAGGARTRDRKLCQSVHCAPYF